VLPYRFDEREIVIIGGPTVGGAAPSESFRGFHLVEVASNHHGRRVSVCDVPYNIAGGSIERELRDRILKQPRAILFANSALIAPAARKFGFRYRDVVSITRIKDDGDAHRLVECDDLIITKQCDRVKFHRIELPPTSGYLDMLRSGAERKDLDVYVKEGIPEGHSSKSAAVELGFEPELRVNREGQDNGVSYEYEWFAVNAFALDKLQFARKYGTLNAILRNVESTHFIPVDPIERLTVIVQFPRNLKLSYPPTLRIMQVNKNNKDSRTWDIDEEERNHLVDIRALRFFETLNIAALRVRFPKAGLNYGIQWTLPDAPKSVPPATLAVFIKRLTTAADDTLKRIYRVLDFSRKALLSGWDRGLDATLMIFSVGETAGFLKTIGAGFTSGPTAYDQAMQRRSRESKVVLEYGDGIAGRAFKANAIRIYQDPSIVGPQIPGRDQSRYEPNFYKTIPGIIPHKALIAFPVHLLVTEAEFAGIPNIYESCEP
jgi:hypothetical protein